MQPIASLSLDLDNQWSYMKTHGDPGWASFPSYLDVAVPRVLEFLKQRNLDITFFIVGQDAALDKNREAIASIAEAGHEIGNHSFSHEPWLHLYSKDQLRDEFERSEAAIEAVTGRRTVGFRAPGFSLTDSVLKVLAERGYEYDCSTLPTYIAPLARAYFFLTSTKMSDAERAKRRKLFGKFSDGFQSLKPHLVSAGGKHLVEIPVTTFPGLKVPVHASYVLYLASFSTTAAMVYWRSALAACSVAGLSPSLLLHPLDLMNGDDVPELKFFPGMNQPLEQKLSLLDRMIELYTSRYRVVCMQDHARSVANEHVIPLHGREVMS